MSDEIAFYELSKRYNHIHPRMLRKMIPMDREFSLQSDNELVQGLRSVAVLGFEYALPGFAPSSVKDVFVYLRRGFKSKRGTQGGDKYRICLVVARDVGANILVMLNGNTEYVKKKISEYVTKNAEAKQYDSIAYCEGHHDVCERIVRFIENGREKKDDFYFNPAYSLSLAAAFKDDNTAAFMSPGAMPVFGAPPPAPGAEPAAPADPYGDWS